MNHSDVVPVNVPAPLQRVEPATCARSIERQTPDASLYSATTRLTPSVPLSSVMSTAKPIVDAAGDVTATGPKLGALKSVSPGGA
jgi:hypothetical protein